MTVLDSLFDDAADVPQVEPKEVPVGEIPFAPTTGHVLPCGHVLITYKASDSLTLRNHKQTCKGTKP